MEKVDDFEGFFEFKLFELGFGQIVGNFLCCVLFFFLEGFVISVVCIVGVEYEFGIICGVVEDVVEIILNFKQVCLK